MSDRSPRRTVLRCLILAFIPSLAWAEAPADAPADADPATELERVTVSATRTERTLAEIPVIVSVVDRERIEETLTRNIKDLVRYEPGVSVRSSFGRFGLSDFRIRGLQGNRVRIEVDGTGIPDAFSIGSFAGANRNFVDLDTLKRVDIVRGPASSLYGSDALGGVVAFTTKDPSDYVAAGQGRHLELRGGVDSVDSSVFSAGTAAFVGEHWSGLLSLNRAVGQERRNQGHDAGDGAHRTRPNPQDTATQSMLAKLGRGLGEAGELQLTLEHAASHAATDVRSGRTLVTGFGPPVQVLDLTGEDQQQRRRVQLDGRHAEGVGRLVGELQWRLSWQQADTRQHTVEHRAPLVGGRSGAVTRRERRFDFGQRIIAAGLTAFSELDTGPLVHSLTWGAELERSDFDQQRDGRAIFPDGSVTHVIAPDTFPVRDFPLSRTRNLAVFVQDEISIGQVRLVPGLRLDRYRLDAREDPLFAARNPGIEPTGIRENSVSPKLGAVIGLSDTVSLFAGYARGFRAPPYNDVNLGFTNLQFGYTARPNPDLRPETSDGFEAGVRWQGRAGHLVASGFANRYDDFIESLRLLGVDPESGLLVFQSLNVEQAEIRGAELSAGVHLGRLAPVLEGWTLRAAGAWQRGRNRDDNQPLPSVDPLNGTLGLAWAGDRVGAEIATRFARRKTALPQAPGDGEAFAPPGYAVADLLLRYDLSPEVRINLGVFNLTDRHYFDWADVPLLAADSPVLDRFTSPGRSVATSVRVHW